MNWPPLTAESSQKIADVLRDVVHSKPKDLIEQVASMLQEQSQWDPAEFEAYFEECKRKPRTYVLEERCPPGADPMTWVPMRYNDDTILLNLHNRALEIVGDIRSADPIDDMKGFLDRASVAFPELQYLKDSPNELPAFQAFRAIYLGCSGCEETPSLDDADPCLAFRCEALVNAVRAAGGVMDVAVQNEDILEDLMVCCLLRAVGANENFQRLFGNGHRSPELAALHAAEEHHEVLPSLSRLPENRRALVIATLQALFPMELLLTAETVPYAFQRVKELLVPQEMGVPFFLCVGAIEYMVKMRTALVTDEIVDLLRLGASSLSSVEKHSGAKAYELLLKKRAERHGWRLLKDDYHTRAVVRLCCLARREETESWNEMMTTVQNLSERDQEVLKNELGRKDGISESPVFILLGLSGMMAEACNNEALGVKAGVALLVVIIRDLVMYLAKTSTMSRVLTLHMEGLTAQARDWRPGGTPFEATPHVIKELGPNEVEIRLMG